MGLGIAEGVGVAVILLSAQGKFKGHRIRK